MRKMRKLWVEKVWAQLTNTPVTSHHVGHLVGPLVGHLVFLHVGHHVQLQVGHHNVFSTLCQGSATLTE